MLKVCVFNEEEFWVDFFGLRERKEGGMEKGCFSLFFVKIFLGFFLC